MAGCLRTAVIAAALIAGPVEAERHQIVRALPRFDVRNQANGQNPTFRAGVSGVNLDVAVTRGGRPVRGLTARDFVLTDSGVAQRVDTASLETLPLSVFLVLDTSGSVIGEKLTSLTSASRALVSTLKTGDRIALITFADRVSVRVPLTPDLPEVVRALESVTPGGPTSLRDATYSALQLIPNDRSRPVIIVFSDGRDNASWLTAVDALGAVRRAGVVVHAVELVEENVLARREDVLGGGRRPEPSSRFLGDLVAASGGRRWASADPDRLTTLFTDALNEMRSRYLLTYYPTNVDRQGWHPLTVRLANGRADITHRPGYQVGVR